MKRLNALSGAIRAALNGPDKAQVQTLFVSVNGLIKKKDFAKAKTALDELEALVASSTAASAAAPPAAAADAPSAAPPAGDAALAAAWERRVIELEPKINEAQKKRAGEAKWQSLFRKAQDLGSDGEFAQAMTILDQLDGLLKAAPSGGVSVMKLGKARIEWKDVRSKAIQDLERFKQILRDEYGSEPKQQAALAAAVKRLDATTGTLDEELGEKLDQVLNADTTQRPQKVTAAKSVLARFVQFIESDDLMSVIDGNEYAPDMKVAEPLRGKLKEIEAVLA
jgi:hypothetical protein